MASDDVNAIETPVTIRHGESVITLPAGSSAGAIADLVKALNRHGERNESSWPWCILGA